MKPLLVIAGLIEFALRAVLLIALCVMILPMIAMSFEEQPFEGFLVPICWDMLR